MKAKTIRLTLRKKIDDWLSSIEDNDVRTIASQNVIVTGGAIASMLLREEINDFDVYFRTREACRMVVDYYVKRFSPKTTSGIPCKIEVREDSNGRISTVVKSAGIASEDGAHTPYDYFEGRPSDEAGTYVAEVLGDPADIEEHYEEAESQALNGGLDDNEDMRPRYRPVFISTNAITLSQRIQKSILW